MVPVRDEESHSDCDSRKSMLNVDLSDDATQPIDSQFSPCGVSKSGGAGDFVNLTKTMTVDAYLLEDAFETQVIDLAGETQVMDLAGETQVMDLAGETQMMDLAFETQLVDPAGETQIMYLAGETQVVYDLDCGKGEPTEFLNDFNAEVAAVADDERNNETEASSETKELPEERSVEIDVGNSVGLGKTPDPDLPKQGDSSSGAPFDTHGDKEHQSGSVSRGFTSIRAASIRASGLAARARGSCGSLHSFPHGKSSLEQNTCEQDGSSLVGYLLKSGKQKDEECLHNEYEEGKEPASSNRYKVGHTAVRRLFANDEFAEPGCSEVDINHINDNHDMPEILASENCSAGLSYVNSQEPGELSQANALKVVDRFLDLNVMEYDEVFDSRVHIVEKDIVVSGTKASRDLAKSTLKSTVGGQLGVYDWDDAREDESGGGFLLRNKKLLFDKGGSTQRYSTKPSKPGKSGVINLKAREDHEDEMQQTCNEKQGGPVYSDSWLMLHKLRAKRIHCDKNLTEDFDEQLDVASGRELAKKNTGVNIMDIRNVEHKLVDNDSSKDINDMENVGPDTQMAAEAMEALCIEVNLNDDNSNDSGKGSCRKTECRKETTCTRRVTQKTPHPTSVALSNRQAKEASNLSSLSLKQSKSIQKGYSKVLRNAEQKKRADVNGFANPGTGRRSLKKRQLEEQLDTSVPVAHRTRKCKKYHSSHASESSVSREEINDLISAPVFRKRRTDINCKNAEMGTIQNIRKVGSNGFQQSNKTRIGTSTDSSAYVVKYLEGERTRQQMLCSGHETDMQHSGNFKRSRKVAASFALNPSRCHLQATSPDGLPSSSSFNQQSEKMLFQQPVDNKTSKGCDAEISSDHVSVEESLNHVDGACKSNQFDKKSDDEARISGKGAEANGTLEASTRERCGTFSTCVTPTTTIKSINNTSPICVGDEYRSQTCRKNLSRFALKYELNNLVTGSPERHAGAKDSRKRKNITNVRALFSQHLDMDVVKQQKKILARLGGAVASSMSDATHFVADEFVRTRNMLEAIAFGKPVVTHLWLESCGQASCLIDEKTYILRDARKEKEFGFCLPVSLSRACQRPLLLGQKVFVTPNTSPGKDILANLVKAVHGLAVERLGRSALKDDKLPEDLLILSCEEDYDVCVPFLEKGGAIYSSELLLNGIVKQKLEFERHRLFADHVKRTRSTIWVKNNNRYLPVAKCK